MKRIFLYIFLIQFSYSWAQEFWLYENAYNHGFQMLESYDGGVIISATEEGQDNLPKVFKLNQSGDLLWEHTFIDNSIIMPACIIEDSQGNIVVAGMTQHYDVGLADGFILKLNPCGELLWFETLYDPGIYNYIIAMTLDKDDNVIIIECNGDTNGGTYYEDTTLKKYSSEGQLILSSVVLPEENSIPQKVISCADGGYMIETNFYAAPYYNLESNVLYLRATLIKTDSLGNVEWRYFHRWEQDTQDTIYGTSNTGSVVEIANGEFISIAKQRQIPNLRPELYKVNAEGETIWSRDVSEDNRTYSNCKMVMDIDSNLILGINVAEGNENYDDDYLEIYKLNLQGDELGRWESPVETSILRDFRWNRDSTSLYVLPGTKLSSLSLYAFKFNTDSMQVDTFASVDNNEYDYYCPEGVVDLNFEFPELSIVEDEQEVIKEQLKIAPNPARDFTYLYFDIADFNRSAKLEIHNMQGALIKSYPLQAAIGRVKEDLSLYSKGVYAVSLIVNDRLVESSKVVVD